MNTPSLHPDLIVPPLDDASFDTAYTTLPELRFALASIQHHAFANPGAVLESLQKQQLANLPLPGSGHTLERWQLLAAVASVDLSLLKLYEGHADAVAIVHELLQLGIPPLSTWGVWCAESPHAQLVASEINNVGPDTMQKAGFRQPVILHGSKAWCSGASQLSHALVSTANAQGERQLVAVALQDNHLSMDASDWAAVGMRHTATSDVSFNGAIGYKVGAINAYIERPGFWHGGAGVAACWYGAATTLGDLTARQCAQSATLNPHTAAHLGAIDVALCSAAAVLRTTADYIDRHPRELAQAQCLRARLAVEHAVEQVLDHAGKALGAAAFCKNEIFARMHADLTVFIRQSHAERDLAALGKLLSKEPVCRL